MSSQEGPVVDGLQFENAEYEAPGPAACLACKNPVTGVYYEVNGKVICPRCRAAVEQYRTGGPGFGRFLRASAFGAGAAFAGFLIYFAVLKITDINMGLISVLVGFMVGAAVRSGSQHRGGWVYQLLAIFLTYTAIAATCSATLIPQLFAEKPNPGAAAPAPGQANPGPAAQPQPAPAAPAPAPQNAPARGAAEIVVQLALLAVMLVGFCYATPVLLGMGSPINLLIFSFALWEAWKLNKRAPLVFNGPFEVGRAPVAGDVPPEGAVSHA